MAYRWPWTQLWRHDESMQATWAEPVLMTADELLVMPDDGWRYELIEGRLVRMSPTGYSRNRVSMNLAAEVVGFVRSHALGVVLGQEAGFVLSCPGEPDTLLAPDLAFITADRLPPADFEGYARLAPDLVAEVISPSQTLPQLQQKATVWLRHGVQVVWLVIPEARTIEVWRPDSDLRTLREGDVLGGEDVLPGLAIPVRTIFAS
jgi:Uma2 family endonuclease